MSQAVDMTGVVPGAEVGQVQERAMKKAGTWASAVKLGYVEQRGPIFVGSGGRQISEAQWKKDVLKIGGPTPRVGGPTPRYPRSPTNAHSLNDKDSPAR